MNRENFCLQTATITLQYYKNHKNGQFIKFIPVVKSQRKPTLKLFSDDEMWSSFLKFAVYDSVLLNQITPS
jgi:hypothetical protein